MKVSNLLLWCSMLSLSLPGISKAQNTELLQIFPADTPETQGISSAVLDSIMLFIKTTNQNIHNITIIRNSKTVLNADIYPYSSEYIHDLASVTKSFTSLLVGIAIEKGFIKDENEKVLNFFPEIKNHNQLLDSMRIKDLITMTSGLACGVSDGEKALSDMRKSTNWAKFIFDLPMTSIPGSTFSYCSCNFYLLGEIIFRTTKLTPYQFAKKYLFGPLNITNTKWLANYKGINHGWGDLFLNTTEMAKIGELVLHKGKWQDKQIVSEEWILKSLKTFSKLPDDKGYGYGWWTNDKVGYYEAAGRGRQTISVIPSKNMVVTMLGGEFDAGMIGKYIFQSIQSDSALAPDQDSFTSLKAACKDIAVAPASKTALLNEGMVHKLNKKCIVFEKNITEIDSMQFDFRSKEKGTVIFYRKHSAETYPFILSTNTYSLSLDSTLQLPVALQAKFENDDQFILHYNQLCRINNFYFYFTIKGDSISTILEETSNYIKTNIASSFR